MDSFAYKYDIRTELLDGKIVAMASAGTNHNTVTLNIAMLFKAYLQGKPCKVFSEGADVYLTKKDRLVPDVMVVCNRDIIKPKGVFGAPDLVVEVLSNSTAKLDRGYKKDLYERSGVKEYWLVDTNNRSIEVHLLQDEKLKLDNVYTLLTDDYIEDMTDEEQADLVHEFKTSLFDDLVIKIEDVFDDMI